MLQTLSEIIAMCLRCQLLIHVCCLAVSRAPVLPAVGTVPGPARLATRPGTSAPRRLSLPLKKEYERMCLSPVVILYLDKHSGAQLRWVMFKLLLLGGNSNNGANCGWYGNWNNTAGNSNWNIGSSPLS